MEFLDKIGKIAKTAADKTGNMMEINRLNSRISSITNTINENKLKIGDFFVQKFYNGEPCPADVSEIYQSIVNSNNEINDLRTEIAAIKEKEQAQANQEAQTFTGDACAACGTANAVGARFCRSCGAKMTPPETTVKCLGCSSENKAGTKFCQTCGTKIEDAVKTQELVNCPSCNASLPAGTKFCGECGGKL